MDVVLKKFPDLLPEELYKIIQIRQDVFVIEQHCIYRDLDDKDFQCYHLMLCKNNEVVGYCRLVPVGVSYPNGPSIGRVCTQKRFRMEGIGMELMQEAMKAMDQLWPAAQVIISAQAYLEKFYQKFGFVTVSEPYLEDDIPHVKMICNK